MKTGLCHFTQDHVLTAQEIFANEEIADAKSGPNAQTSEPLM